jgi:hypothetical protein
MFSGTTNGKPVSAAVNYAINGVKVKSIITPKLLFSGDDLAIGESKTGDITISNEGSAEVTYTASVIKGDEYSFEGPNQIVLAPGTQGAITVRFTPTTEGAKSGSVLVSPSGDKSVTVALAGSAHKQDQMSSVKASASQDGFSLSQNIPNPATGATSIAFALPKTAHVRISLLDMTGKQIKEIASGTFSEGDHSAMLSTNGIASGTYIYVLESDGVRLSQSMVITK